MSTYSQLWVYGSSFENFLVAVVVPKQERLQQAVEQQGVAGASSLTLKVCVVCVFVCECALILSKWQLKKSVWNKRRSP